MKRVAVLGTLAFGMTGCDSKPAHYLISCDERDGQNWELVDYVKSNGYITSCTYRSPDRRASYTRSCDSSGCNITR